jgi:hypothetical protein
MVLLLRQESNAGHERKGLAEVLEREFAAQFVVLFGPSAHRCMGKLIIGRGLGMWTKFISSIRCFAPANLSTMKSTYRASTQMLRHFSGSNWMSLMVLSHCAIEVETDQLATCHSAQGCRCCLLSCAGGGETDRHRPVHPVLTVILRACRSNKRCGRSNSTSPGMYFSNHTIQCAECVRRPLHRAVRCPPPFRRTGEVCCSHRATTCGPGPYSIIPFT